MGNLDTVYCIECNSTMAKCYAKKIFKTGFYHTTIPLAHCLKCESLRSMCIHRYEEMTSETWI
ncbi:NAD-dependent SIR2 family protein deacetylase [Paenibacillus aceris]|uniref:NAD-dependent SIR2 family protein deacetylase n=1 Tax=Paenibacillus aceris TaxID=869555 RepID=A0ABS4I822_9BACL|nr:NAD-dependent SIR2 family protein deacetylase [Paenibacillus aceris]